jgi:type IV fimbrial biogenesis protein FimT
MTKIFVPWRHSSRGRAGGFTLIELLITIAIAAIAMTLGVPSFITFQRNAELTSAANSLTAAINAARGEAMKRNINAFVIPFDGSNWNSGYKVFAHIGNSLTVGTGDVIVMTQPAPPSYLSVTGYGTTATATAPYLMFNGSGYATNTAAGLGGQALKIKRTDVSGTAQYDQIRNVMIARTGRVRTCKPANPPDANCVAGDLASGDLD